MHYVVPGMKLIPQDKAGSCWFASAQMLLEWYNNKTLACHVHHPDPKAVQRWSKLYDADNGIRNHQILDMAYDLGMEIMYPQSPAPEGLARWLQDYGPLWVNGRRHITVMAGLRDTMGAVETLVYDPLLPNKKHGEWRDLKAWYIDDDHSGRDTGAQVETVFLHMPKH